MGSRGRASAAGGGGTARGRGGGGAQAGHRLAAGASLRPSGEDGCGSTVGGVSNTQHNTSACGEVARGRDGVKLTCDWLVSPPPTPHPPHPPPLARQLWVTSGADLFHNSGVIFMDRIDLRLPGGCRGKWKLLLWLADKSQRPPHRPPTSSAVNRRLPLRCGCHLSSPRV